MTSARLRVRQQGPETWAYLDTDKGALLLGEIHNDAVAEIVAKAFLEINTILDQAADMPPAEDEGEGEPLDGMVHNLQVRPGDMVVVSCPIPPDDEEEGTSDED